MQFYNFFVSSLFYELKTVAEAFCEKDPLVPILIFLLFLQFLRKNTECLAVKIGSLLDN